ncbi:helix-turn-helix transcriptional regulator [Georgenia sp. H159]|uniref:helix-turn-helix transcriptional regulator n=1 Tax=Georgenia sp. H159 TaxID=3076115 RepID=UPI002D79D2CE|nr:helix-turn-helix domain-containing protein [Georgenia sp. H159]
MRQSPARASADRARAASRLRVLEVLRTSASGCHVQQIAERTSLHPNTVRFHLERLENEGLVSRHVRRSGDPGRPRLAYVATVPDVAAGRRHFGQLAEVLARLVSRTNEDPAAVAVEAGRAWGLSRSELSGPTPDGAAAIAELTATLDELGFAPEVRAADDEGHAVVVQRHCPFLEVAESHQDVVCSVHLGLMRGTLEGLSAPVSARRLVPFATSAGCEAHLVVGGAPPAG